jgi:hypothetical protein
MVIWKFFGNHIVLAEYNLFNEHQLEIQIRQLIINVCNEGDLNDFDFNYNDVE